MCARAQVATGRGARKRMPATPQQPTIVSMVKPQEVEGTETDRRGESDEGGRESDKDEREIAEEDIEQEGANDSVDMEQEDNSVNVDMEQEDNSVNVDMEQEDNSVNIDMEQEDNSVNVHMEQEDEISAMEQEQNSLNENHPFFASFRDYLSSRHGKGRSQGEAKQVAAEARKYLQFCGPVLDATNLYNPLKLNQYLTQLESTKKASTQYSVLCRLRHRIQFVNLGLDSGETMKAEKCLTLVANWIAAIGKEVRRTRRIHLEDMSDKGPVPISTIDDFCQSPVMTKRLDTAVRRAKESKKVPLSEVRHIGIWLAGSLLHSNAQRPGAISNATLKEYENSSVTTVGRESYTTFYVEKHKTGTGRAKITAGKHLATQLDKYVKFIRPLAQVGDSNILFPNTEGRPIDHLSRCVNTVTKSLGIKLPSTATETRHSAATAIQGGTEQQRNVVATTMSHSRMTQEVYYSLKKGQKEAVEGYRLMEGMRRREANASGGGRSLFTPEQTETIRSFFGDHIASRTPPSLEECRQFVKQHPIGKEPKNVRDKVRNLIGR